MNAQSWYAALSLALAIPDIAGWVETPPTPGQSNSKARYKRWFESNVQPTYTRHLPGEAQPHVFLNGADCYALRCAYLHQGDFDTTGQQARDVIERFQFVVPPPGSSFHRMQKGALLLLGVPEFCGDMVAAAERWIPTVTDTAARQRLRSLASIEQIDFSKGFSF